MSRILNILIVFPEESTEWTGSIGKMRARLAPHKVEFVGGIENAGPYMADAEVILSFQFREEYARAAKRLEWIQGFGAGVESLVSPPSLGPNVIITNMRGIHADAVSEGALGLMFALARDFQRIVHQNDERHWEGFNSCLLTGKTLGILGVGSISEGLATRAKGLRMKTVGISDSRTEAEGFDKIHRYADLTKVVGMFDYFVLLAPVTPATTGIVDASVISAMKPTAFIVNVGRGALVKDSALIDALRNGRIAGAGLDTVTGEPLKPDNPWWGVPRVVFSPHNSGRHDGYIDDALDIFTANIGHFLNGETSKMINIIDRKTSRAT